MRNLAQWLDWIACQHPKAIDLSLERVHTLAKRLNLDDFSCPIITVGGTNGKGSTIACLNAIYSTEGYRTGVYTSPHLLEFNERIVIGNRKVEEAQLISAFEMIESALLGIKLTYFEFTTLAALYLFKNADLDLLLLEVGLGGRLDAVNILDADLSILTTVDLDHCEYLGNTREAIGFEKAGIFRPHRPAIYGDESALTSVCQFAAEQKALLYLRGVDFSYEVSKDSWSWRGLNLHYANLPKPKILLQNASLALQAISLLQDCLTVSETAIRQGLSRVEVLGRFQILGLAPRRIIDVAHNPQSSAQLRQQLMEQGSSGQLRIVFSMLETKDLAASLTSWREQPAIWYLAPLKDPAGASLQKILAQFETLGFKQYRSYDTVGQAYAQAVLHSSEEDTLLVFGSFHTVAEVLQEEKKTCTPNLV